MSLTLRLGDEIITDQVTNIGTKNVINGGYASVTFNVKRKLDQSLFDTFQDVFTYDPATGEQTGGGRLLEQGRNDDGTWQVTCLGEGLASMQDVTTPVFYIDSDINNWVSSSRTTSRLTLTAGNYPVQSDDDQTLVCVVREGIVLAVNDEIVMINKLPGLCEQLIGGFGFRHKAGISNSNFRTRGHVWNLDHSATDNPIDDAWSTTITGRRITTVDGDFSNRSHAGISFKRITTVSPTSTEDYWAAARDIIIRAQIYGSSGSLITTGYTDEYVLAHQVLTDWVVRYCPRLNAATGTIDTASAEQITQMTYIDGINGMKLAEDLAAFESGYVWRVWGQDADGTWPFYYGPLPEVVQYEASTRDGFRAPTPGSELYDEVVVTGKTSAGRDINTTSTQTLTALDAVGIHKRATVPLGSEVWSTSAASRVGSEYLAGHAVTPSAGTITIARPVFDNTLNRWIGPQHIRSGGLMRVRGIQPTPDSLNATAPDGVTVFRVMSATYDDDSNSTVCELDSYTLTPARTVTQLAQARPRRGKS